MPNPDQNLPVTKVTEKESILIRNWLLGDTPAEAARKADYSPSYIDSDLYTKFSKPNFQTKVSEVLRGLIAEQGPKVYSILKKTIEAYDNDPQLAINKPKLLERELEILGVLKPEQHGGVANITNIQNLTVIQGGLRGYLEDVPEAEVVEEGQIEAE